MNPETKEQLDNEMEASRQMQRIKDKFLDKFFADKEAQVFSAIKDLPLGDVDKLNSLHMMIKSLQSLQSEVNSVMNTGKLANLALAEELDKRTT